MNCPNAECQELVLEHSRACVVCGRDVGYPNMRAARSPLESGVLAKRYQETKDSAHDRGCADAFRQFEEAAASSRAVVCRPLSVVQRLVSSDNELYTTYYNQVSSSARTPEDNRWDRARESVASAVFPHYYREVNYGALSISGVGHQAYGDYSMVLKDGAISERASVFEGPLFPFLEGIGVQLGQEPPHGHRAPWENRGQLCATKIGPLLQPDTSAADFETLLLEPTADTEGECIEVHIYGPIHRRAVEKVVVCGEPTRRADRVLRKELQRTLEEAGSTLELHP